MLDRIPQQGHLMPRRDKPTGAPTLLGVSPPVDAADVDTANTGDDLGSTQFLDDVSGDVGHGGILRYSQDNRKDKVALFARDILCDFRNALAAMPTDWIARIQKGLEQPGKTQAGLAAALGVHESAVSRMLKPGGRKLKADEIPKVMAYFGWAQESPQPAGPSGATGELSGKLPLLSEVARAEILPPQLLDMPKDVPVYGTAYGGQGGDFELNGQLIDHARRPPSIASSKTVFCVYVQGDSMAPWRQPGELVYLNPDRPARPGDYVVVELQGKRGEPAPALLKRLVAVSGSTITLEQFNPPSKDIKVERRQVKRIIRVIDWMELLGV